MVSARIPDQANGGALSEPILNALSIDVEEHFQVSAFAGVVPRESWESEPSRVEAATERLLGLLDEHEVRATFFVLGWIAERHAALVRRIAAAGHEVGCHGYDHALVYDLEPHAFRREVERAKRVLEDAAGQPVCGFRAASFSITRASLWATDVLAECGFTYDSSIFPVRHDRYGIPGAPRGIHRLETPAGRAIVEVPPATLRIAGLVLPVGGGGYLRHYPLWLTRWALGRLNRVERMPAVVYLHPWEVDPGQPRIRAPWTTRLRHYRGLGTTLPRLGELLRRFAFAEIRAVLAASGSLPAVERAAERLGR